MSEPTTLMFPASITKIDAIELDASVSETHASEVEVTEHAVEEGANIADHARVKPVTLTIEGLITNTPINRSQALRAVESQGFIFQTSSQAQQIRGIPGYAEEAWAKLEQLRDNPRLITVITSLKSYTDMILVSLSAPRNASIGEALRFTATFKSVRLVRNQTVQVKVTKTTAGQAKKNLGPQASKAAPDGGEREMTALAAAWDTGKKGVNMIGKMLK